eukprot:s2889_g14.t1
MSLEVLCPSAVQPVALSKICHLRLVHMYWQEMELNAEENISLLVMNPLKSRFSQDTVKSEPGTDMLYTCNRLWLDHCLTTGSVERFALEPAELETGMIFELQ